VQTDEELASRNSLIFDQKPSSACGSIWRIISLLTLMLGTAEQEAQQNPSFVLDGTSYMLNSKNVCY
jgi:hypothetical protein